MSTSRRLLAHLLLALLAPALAAIFFAGPASAARSSVATRAVAATHQKPPCGIKHYPRCPPKHVIHTGHRHKHPGQNFHIGCRNFPPHKTIHVRIFGHHHNRLLAVLKTDSHGNAEFAVTIPDFKPGVYHMTIRVFGSKSKTIRFVVERPKHHHHH